MLKKPITYTDYEGNQRTEDHFFNLNKFEVIELNAKYKGGLVKTLEKVLKDEDEAKIIEIIKDLIIRSYGEKSEDGKRFIKNEEVVNNFMQTEAFSELFIELSSDSEKAAAFFNGVMPKADGNAAIPPAK